ncbi:hypothetical protein N7508_009740 [Penicillium antarcticum]|uniref:uncharacterized protein n=1 Tax=Penicillium antarcticum TaxID=416450 RepID=UPI002388BF7F|nr:uncharacterized protein N7508_009740 [Penicillium antarcticum]KAJ5294919.1 hypothetical protein N7508_009740 [Penicillium antarcticum]
MDSHAPESSNKRPRSPTADHAVSSKVQKTLSSHLQINYLARQYPDNLPLVSVDDTMPAIIHLLSEYDGVLHRHESIAGNLGACPLGPILIKRFERLFDGPPQVLKSHGKDGPTVTWLDVVEFAKNKPEQFNLEKSRNGVRVCQFYTKQCRVEISEEDFVLIASGMPQKMIPPQPIIEDEEKELGALEILEKNLQHITQMADQVSARARQLNHRLKNRRTAIVTRRENDATLHANPPSADIWRDPNAYAPVNGGSSHASPAGFLAVNTHRPETEHEENPLSSQFMFSHSNTDNVTMINGTSIKGASPTTRADLMKKFFTTADRQARGYDDPGAPPVNPQPRPRPGVSDAADFSPYTGATATPVAIPSTPSSLLPPPKTTHQEKDDGGPFKLEMIARMEELQRGERVIPPCDRCRRLHMDCLKNLTACVGCTKKHAKCSWRDVKEDEVAAMRASTISASHDRMEIDRSSANLTPPQFGLGPLPPISAERERIREQPFDSVADANKSYHGRRESAPSAPNPIPATNVPMELPSTDNSPRRAVSETEGRGWDQHDRRVPTAARVHRAEDEDPDANQRLMQAILDTVDHHTRVAAAVQEKERGAERADNQNQNQNQNQHLSLSLNQTPNANPSLGGPSPVSGSRSGSGAAPGAGLAAGPSPVYAHSHSHSHSQPRVESDHDHDRDRDRDRRMVPA